MYFNGQVSSSSGELSPAGSQGVPPRGVNTIQDARQGGGAVKDRNNSDVSL